MISLNEHLDIVGYICYRMYEMCMVDNEDMVMLMGSLDQLAADMEDQLA